MYEVLGLNVPKWVFSSRLSFGCVGVVLKVRTNLLCFGCRGDGDLSSEL